MRILFGLFLAAHGLVHAMYVGQALRVFEVKPGMMWPDGSWALAGLLGNPGVRWLVAAIFSLIAAAFVVSGVALIARQAWWGQVAAATAVVSTITLLLAWNGQLRGLDAQGLYAVVINVVVVVTALVLHWPQVSR